jgi:hypothetical protein
MRSNRMPQTTSRKLSHACQTPVQLSLESHPPPWCPALCVTSAGTLFRSSGAPHELHQSQPDVAKCGVALKKDRRDNGMNNERPPASYIVELIQGDHGIFLHSTDQLHVSRTVP